MRFLLAGILVLALFLRIVNLSSYPAGFTPDEASFGYDAYSLLATGRDQWGQAWPLVLESFGDYKPALYSYLAIPAIAIFGLNEAAVRLPNALLGTFAILVTYLFTQRLFGNRSIAYLAAFLVAISPWHIALSRGAFEANLTTFFLPLGLWFFLKGLDQKKWMWAAAVVLGLNLFTYHSARLLTPVIIFGLFWWKGVNLKKYKWPAVLFLLFLAVALYTLLFGGARSSDIAVFNPTDNWAAVADRRYESVLANLPDPIARIFSNKVAYTFDKFSSSYLTYLSPQFLFTEGASEWTYGMIPGRGVLYIVEIASVLFALWMIVKKPDNKIYFLLFWILIVPIPAALAKGPGFAANRAAIMMPAIQILSAYGAFHLWNFLQEKTKQLPKNIFMYGYMAILIVSLGFFLEDYFYHAPKDHARAMLYGRKQAIEYASLVEDKYDEIIISRQLSEPHIYVGFYKRWDSRDYQQESRDWGRYRQEGLLFLDQLGEYSLGKYTFKNIEFSRDSKLSNALLIGKPSEFPEDVATVKTIDYPDGEPAIKIVDPRDEQ